jgi:hypothetical protein
MHRGLYFCAFAAISGFALLCSDDEANAQGKGGMPGGKAQAGARQAGGFLNNIDINIGVNIGNGGQGKGKGGMDKGGQGKGGQDKGGQGKGKGGMDNGGQGKGGQDKGGQGKGKGGMDKGGQGKGKGGHGGQNNGGIGNMHPDIWIQIQIQIYLQQMAQQMGQQPANPIGGGGGKLPAPILNPPNGGGKQPQPQNPVIGRPLPGQMQMFNAMQAGGQVGGRNLKQKK